MIETREVWVVIFYDARGISREVGEFQREEDAVLRAHEMVTSYATNWEARYGYCTIEHRVLPYRE